MTSPRPKVPVPDRATTSPAPRARGIKRCLCLAAALAVALLFAGRMMAPGWSPRVVQDDVRYYVYWMTYSRDPAHAHDDLIASYARATTPPGYAAVYALFGIVVPPLTASKLLLVGLGLAAALFTFLFAARLHPSPVVALL